MLDSRYIGAYPRLQGIPASFSTTKVNIYRLTLVVGHVANDGPFGESEYAYTLFLRGWPAAVVPRSSELEVVPAGPTERGDFILLCQYRKLSDGGLIIRERDIVVDVSTQTKYLVLWSHDPMNSHLQIVAGLQFGTANEDLTEQFTAPSGGE